MIIFRYIQVLIPNPLTFDNHAFDIGVYVLITSIDPLIVYRWKKDIHLRFCNEPYEPFDNQNLKKINCALNSKDPSEMPSFKKLVTDFQFSYFDTLNYQLRNQEHDPEKLWEQIDEAIASVTLLKSKSITKYLEIQSRITFNQTGRAFELLRYDFIVDSKLKPHLLEINMSPNFIFEGVDKERNQVMAKQLLVNTLKIVGAGSYSELMEAR